MSLYPPPEILEAEVWTTMPAEFRRTGVPSAWADANKGGERIDSFLEGPSFDRAGHLWVTDLAHGRIFRISPEGAWTLVADYDGWPNGLKIHKDGTIWIADYANGILTLDPGSGDLTKVLSHRHTEHFRGCNDLVFDSAGRLWFTDQGQSGMHMPNGRVYRYDLAADRLDLMLDTGPSPNGLVPELGEGALLVGMTRGNAIWRMPILPDGTTSKVGVFIQLSGGLSGPDGMALDAQGGIWVAHAGNGCVWGFDRLGRPKYRVVAPEGLTTTNVAFGGPDLSTLYVTQADTGEILRVRLPVSGLPMYAHA